MTSAQAKVDSAKASEELAIAIVGGGNTEGSIVVLRAGTERMAIGT